MPTNFFPILLLTFMLFLSGFSNQNLQATESEQPLSPTSQVEVERALRGLEKIAGFKAEEDLVNLIPSFYTLPIKPIGDAIKELFEKVSIALWSGKIAEFLGLSDILFEGLPPDKRRENLKEYTKCRDTLLKFQQEVTKYVLAIHPGFSFLDIDNLTAKFKGHGISIAVFDVFDLALLEKQRQIYPKATIRAPLAFGNPLEMSHGNVVIDIILRIAPEVEIIPVWSDAKAYTKAILEIGKFPEIDILNMSRAFPEDPATRSLDLVFKNALRKFTEDRILVKALGNTGTDLFGTLNRRRVELGLGPVNNISSYDLKLIRNFYNDPLSVNNHLEILALNLSLFAEEIALTATVPGSISPVYERTLGVPAEGVYAPSTQSFESGSSFAAPQIVAISALLLESRYSQFPQETKREARQSVYFTILKNANLQGHSSQEWGRGIPTGNSY